MEYQLINKPISRLQEIEQILMNRGIPLIDVYRYLHTSPIDIIPPTEIANIKEGASLLVKHISQNSKVMLQIDSDCDGFTSFAVFMNYLNNLFPAFVQNNIVYKTHKGKSHGIDIDEIPKDTKLVIALDASSNEYEIHQKLREAGMDVLIIDHHEATEVSPDACVINNQLCDYPNKSLSGVGMVYKFCCYLDQLLGVDNADKYLDLVALGMIADMMDLRYFETKHLIQLGCENIRSPFIKMMMARNEYSIKGQLTPFTVGFYIAPYINAVARVGTQEETLLLAESMLEYRAYEQIPSTKRGCSGQTESRVEQACRTANNVRNRQNKARDVSTEFVDKLIETNNLLDNKILVVQAPKANGLDTNITGLIGNQTSAKYQHPVLILNERNHDGEIWWEGSARGLSDSELTNFKEFLINTGLVEYAEGHPNAFGVGIKDQNIQKFIEFTNEKLKDIDFRPIYWVDFIYKSDTLNPNTILTIGQYNYLWGQQLDKPKIAIEDINITPNNVQVMKGPSLKFTINGIEYIKFKAAEEEIKLFQDNAIVNITIVGECDINTWGGVERPQIIIVDYEVNKAIKYYI